MKEEPDSARSWAIASAGFVINFFLSGVSRSTALFYIALIESYGISRMNANMPFTLRSIIRNFIGPLVGVMGQRYGSRELTIAGGLFAFVGVASCAFVSDITWLCFFWGGIYGTGVALGNTLYTITVNQYFERHRATASGFSFSGACFGTFIFPIFFEYLLANVGLSGSFLLTGGLMLHVVPAGMLMKEPSWIQKKSKTTFDKNVDYESARNDQVCSGKPNTTGDSSGKAEEIFAIAYKRRPSTHDKVIPERRQDVMMNNECMKNGVCNLGFEEVLPTETKVRKLKTDDKLVSSPERKNSVYQETVQMICDPMFHIISLSLAALIIILDICITILVDYLKDKGISESDGKYFITILSVGDLIGRLGFGWVTDRKYLSHFKYMMLLQIIQGTIALMPFLYSFYSLMIIVILSGMASGASTVMFPILVATYLPTVQSLAISSTCFAGGIIAFAVPPMIGYFRDVIGSYDGLYFVLGSFSIMTGFLWCLEPLLMKKKTNSRNADSFTEMSPQIQKV